MTFGVFIALTALSSLITAAAAGPKIQVGFLASDSEESEFWGGMARFARAVAEDLDIDLRVVYPGEGSFEKDGLTLVNGMNEGAYFVTFFLDERSHRMLQAAEARSIRSFLINSEISSKHREQVGAPRESLRHWIGHMRPDDVQAGYELADLLIHRFQGPDAIRMIAINGHSHLQPDADRRTGLSRRLAESKGAVLYETKEGAWRETTAREVTTKLLRKYPDANAVWTASDSMALGAIAAVRDLEKQPGKDVVIVGVDWTRRGLEAVRSGDMLGSVGGHLFEAGIALLLIYDYHHGHDFADELGASFKSSMLAMQKVDADKYLRKVGRAANPDWSPIDFKRFTKTHNVKLDRYDFSWERIVEDAD